MKITVPESIDIQRKDFMLELFALMFPDMQKFTGHSCVGAIYDMCLKMDICENHSAEHSYIRFLAGANSLYKSLFGEKAGFLESYYSITRTLCEYKTKKFSTMENRTVKGWIDGDGDKRINDSFEYVLLFSYFLLKNEDTDRKKFCEFYEKCLTLLGITDIQKIVWDRMVEFDWNQSRNIDFDGLKVDIFNDKSILFFTMTLGTVMALLGRKVSKDTVNAYHRLFKEMFADELNASVPIEFSQKILFESNKMFEPRSISKAGSYYPEDYYIPIDFECKSENGTVTPIAAFADSDASVRNIICAKTGYGKSVYMQMITVCMLASSMSEDDLENPDDKKRLSAIKEMGVTLGVPEGKLIISIPAKMFSACYEKKTKGIENGDFVELFFDSMWHLSSKYNFFSPQNFETTQLKKDVDTENWTVTGAIKDYLHSLAKEGKLILLLDSFDEIRHGEMRNAYLKSISKFYDEYCNYSDNKAIGAHILMTTRQMSDETMARIYGSLGISSDNQKFTIKSLSDSAKLKLIGKWCNEEQVTAEENLARFKENHFYDEYSQNPYMLSVVCSLFGTNLARITGELMDTLINRMLINNQREKNLDVQDVLYNIREILRSVAIDTVLEDKHSFSEGYLSSIIKKRLDTEDMPDEVIAQCIEKIFSIFVTEVGLIVPADGEDKAYQFINNQIRYQLATEGFTNILSGDLRAEYMGKLLARKVKMSEYTGLLVPLLCAEGTENIHLADELIRGLVMHDYKTDEDAFYLLRAMADLILGRYGTSVATVSLTNDTDREDILKCQRMLVIRLLSAAEFAPTEKEKADILASNAYRSSESWLCEAVKKLLTQ